LTDDASIFLQSQVRNARQAASVGDVAGALAQLRAAAAVLDRLQGDGSVSNGRADDIRAAIDDARAALEASVTTTPSTEPTDTTDTTEPSDTTESTEAPTTVASSTTEPSTTTTTGADEQGNRGKGSDKRGKGDRGDD
jgi:multidrug resistance efflux pump